MYKIFLIVYNSFSQLKYLSNHLAFPSLYLKF